MTFVVTALVEKLEQTKEPWQRITAESHSDYLLVDTGIGSVLSPQSGLGFNSSGRLIPTDNAVANANLLINLKRQQIADGHHSGGAQEARKVLASLGINQADEDSPTFQRLSLEMLKLDVVRETIKHARASGDYKTEVDYIDHYRRLGYVLPAIAAPTGPKLSDAWKQFAAEKTGALPAPVWSAKTAAGQEAMFAEFVEIIGNIYVNQITRDTMLAYRNSVARVPKNRTKLYPGKTITELLEMEIPPEHRPADRTVKEKLVQVGAFLKWCRDTKHYLTINPMSGVHFDAESQSYAPFTPSDLEKLFYSEEYKNNEHLHSWQFWVPLVALYTGARQSEIAQLESTNVVEEDGVWIFAITDSGEDQSIKTSAGVRKVPISSKLKALGFLDYAEFIKQRGDNRLFPDIPRGKHGWGERVSRWFNDTYKKKCGIKPDATGRRKVFHSFRHAAITKATNAGQPIPHCQKVFGHEQSLLGETATYIGEYEPKTLAPVIEALDWGLDHSAYEDSWHDYVKRWSNAKQRPQT